MKADQGPALRVLRSVTFKAEFEDPFEDRRAKVMVEGPQRPLRYSETVKLSG